MSSKDRSLSGEVMEFELTAGGVPHSVRSADGGAFLQTVTRTS